MKKKYALVLGGGGAKGSYQIGVWKALREEGFEFNCVIGSSVGSLNGALVVLDLYEEALDLWNNLSIDKVVSVPKELMIEGKFNLNKQNFDFFRLFQKKILENKGLDTTPLKGIIKGLMNEEKLRQSEIDFGFIAYEVNSLKPIELFKEDIPNGMFEEYLLGSSTFPGFKATEINGKLYLDGGLYDNLPFYLAKERGYNKIIMVDISGPGLYRRPEIEGTETIFIKNSVDLGNVLDFNPRLLKRNFLIGYLDAQKILGNISGIKYFYNIDKNILEELEDILVKEEFFREYENLFEKKIDNKNRYNIISLIREILPKEISKTKQIIIPLMECTAKLLNIEVVKQYDLKEFIQIIWDKLLKIKEKDNKGINDFEKIINTVKNINPMNFFEDSTKYNIIDFLFETDNPFYIKTLNVIFKEIIPTKIFYIVLQKYFKS
ncbi:MAG: hypothetical protein A2Y34_10600 [Spirochaetes bacterium GWC1_27_15]|nr:MAG: hypothetical protein A2Y34_10600 [Spirochaetes bacterium GWC1_27_15]